jgi:hypothetical protein
MAHRRAQTWLAGLPQGAIDGGPLGQRNGFGAALWGDAGGFERCHGVLALARFADGA